MREIDLVQIPGRIRRRMMFRLRKMSRLRDMVRETEREIEMEMVRESGSAGVADTSFSHTQY
jgi:hypothetical protein